MGKYRYGTGNTRFKHKPSIKWTLVSPKGRDKNVMHFILVNKRWAGALTDIEVSQELLVNRSSAIA